MWRARLAKQGKLNPHIFSMPKESLGMYGENLDLITMRCCVCKTWLALRVDKDDLDRPLRDGVFVQHAFVRRDGTPYLSAAERELFPACSGTCESCYALLCPSDRLAYN
jgi:hypothetical protein